MSGKKFTRVIALADFPNSGIASIRSNGWHVVVARVGNAFHALNDRCSHAASPLSTGRLRHGVIICPLHGARFDLASGKCIGNAYRAVRSFPVRMVDGWIEVALPSTPPDLAESPVMP
ncbi:MAG: Rieske 2Fe-2S domain-containing protein [Sandarakinorhabdus sp.]|nr:Rieske 2Fe-2S domain-containing protein [Sandarakinorhabdus sp.]